ncbi:unnamed protein product [Diamesa serratosioi]
MKYLYLSLPLLMMVQLSLCLGKNQTKPSDMTVRFTNMACQVLDPIFATDISCNIKAYSRTQSTANFGFMLKKKLTKVMVKVIIEYKYGNVFREVINPPQADWCNFQKSKSLFFSMVVDLIKDTAPQLVHKCPYFGRLDVFNMTLNANKFLSVFSEGDYRIVESLSSSSTRNNIRFTSLICTVFNKITLKDVFCGIKAYSRTYSTVNFGGFLTKNLTNIEIDLKVEYKYGTVFRDVMNPPSIEWCTFQKNSNVVFSMIVDLIKDSAPSLIHDCPYFGQVNVHNLTLNVNKFLSLFNQGDYRVTVDFKDFNEDLFRLVLGLNNKSPIKSSFG